MTKKHSPLPWSIDVAPRSQGGHDICIRDKNKNTVLDTGMKSVWLATHDDFYLLTRMLLSHDALIAACEDWMYFAEQKLHEFDIEGDECDPEAPLCPRCEECGCIQKKIRSLRSAIAIAKQED